MNHSGEEGEDLTRASADFAGKTSFGWMLPVVAKGESALAKTGHDTGTTGMPVGLHGEFYGAL